MQIDKETIKFIRSDVFARLDKSGLKKEMESLAEAKKIALAGEKILNNAFYVIKLKAIHDWLAGEKE
jgi:hypothetical protein